MNNYPKFDVESSRHVLASGAISVSCGDEHYEGNGDIVLYTSPKPRIIIECAVEGVAPQIVMMSGFGEIKMSDFRFESLLIPGTSSNFWGPLDGSTNSFTWYPSRELVCLTDLDNKVCDSIKFSLFNFREMFLYKRDNCGKPIGGVHDELLLESETFRLKVSNIATTFDLHKKIRHDLIYAQTNVCEIEYPKSVSCDEAKKTFEVIEYFFSFANGRKCPIVHPIGYLGTGCRVQWAGWYASGVEPASLHSHSWFDDYMGSYQLSCLFPCFAKKLLDPLWGRALKEAIYWYNNANDMNRGLEAGIILVQAAFELLAYTLLVEDRKILWAKTFKGSSLPAADKLRLLFSSLLIPLHVPEHCKQLTELKATSNWSDFPHAFTEVRNSIVHPGLARKQTDIKVYYETWNASLYYLELCILAICGYDEMIHSRLNTSQEAVKVPWNS